MMVIREPQKLSSLLKKLKRKGKSIGLVPTMGALHAGHLSLIRQSRQDNDFTVVSIFVNPTQFGKREDLKRYPRPFKNDIRLCREAQVDLVFFPSSQAMYPESFATFIHVESLSRLLCGMARPGHFRGVATVVAKLLNIVSPDLLYLGQKDAQQSIIIQRLVQDLNFSVKIKVLPIVRESSGLALSSRNAYLDKIQKQEAQVLFKALNLARMMVKYGQSDAGRIIQKMKQLISRKKQAKIDYVAIVDPRTLQPLKTIGNNCLVCLAVKFGKTRLIDNLRINRG